MRINVIYQVGTGVTANIILEAEQSTVPRTGEHVILPEVGRMKVVQVIWSHPNKGDEELDPINVFVIVAEIDISDL